MSAQFVRLRRIELLSANVIDEMLRRRTSSHFPMPDAEIAQQLADDEVEQSGVSQVLRGGWMGQPDRSHIQHECLPTLADKSSSGLDQL